MEIDPKTIRELQRKIELEKDKREIEVTEAWRTELEVIYRKKYENLNALMNDIRNLTERMTNRIKILTKMVKEGV